MGHIRPLTWIAVKEELTHELKQDLSKDIADVVKAEMAAAAVATGVREDSINVDNIGTYDRYSYCGEMNTTDNNGGDGGNKQLNKQGIIIFGNKRQSTHYISLFKVFFCL